LDPHAAHVREPHRVPGVAPPAGRAGARGLEPVHATAASVSVAARSGGRAGRRPPEAGPGGGGVRDGRGPRPAAPLRRRAGPLVTVAVSARGLGKRYGTAEAWALRGVELDVPPGGALAVVGENGSGK